jgi:hypothetical protein
LPKLAIRYMEPSEYDIWDEFVETSPQGTIYSSTLWLSLSGMPFKVLGCFDGNNELVGGISFTESRRYGFKRITSPLLTPFQGILLKEDPQLKMPRKISRRTSIVDSIIRKLEEDYDGISFRNHITFDDIRPFSWHGYSINVRYTYILDSPSPDILWENFNATERKQIRSISKHGVEVEIGEGKYSILDFDKIHQLTFARHGVKCPIPTDYLIKLYNGVKEAGKCQIYSAYNGDSELISSSIFGWDTKRGYALLTANHPVLIRNNRGASALVHWFAFRDLSNMVPEIDFAGANTPGITDFKRRFGGELRHYFGVSKTISPYLSLCQELKGCATRVRNLGRRF